MGEKQPRKMKARARIKLEKSRRCKEKGVQALTLRTPVTEQPEH